MELKIYNQADELKLTVSPNSSSTVTEEVMGECAVSVGFTHTEFVMLDVNDYVEIEGIRYRNMSQYRPKQKNTQTYEYSVKFYAPIHQAENTLMLFTPDGEMKSEFVYDGSPRDHVQLWVDNMNRIAGENVWQIGTVITGENKTIEYRNVKCWDAAFGSNGIAAAFDTEMWADGYYINLCKAERGVRVDLGYMQGLTNLSQEENGEVKFFTRLFPLGSTRNIDASKYGHARLQLPGGVRFVDKNVEIYGVKEEFEEEAFAEIYPKYIGTVQSVRTADFVSEEGRPYTVYYIKDTAMDFNPNDYEIPEYIKMVAFHTGELAGRGDDEGNFQANWHEDTKEWEIINVYPDENTQIPGGLIVPKPGDTYIPWNFRMPDEYITAAESALQKAVEDYLDEYSFDTKKYSGQTDRNYIEDNNIKLITGLNVRLVSDKYFSLGYKDTRITKIVRQLNDLCQATITCTDKIGTGWKATVQNNIGNLQYEIAKQAESIVFDLIRSNEFKTASDKNVFTALKSLETLLRKDAPDKTEYLMKLLGGVIAPFFETPDFVGGAMGAGAVIRKNADGSSYAEVDKLLVRKKALFQTLAILETELAGADFLFNASGARATITKVEYIDSWPLFYSDGSAKYYSDGKRAYVQPGKHGAVYRCYFLTDDGEESIENRFRVGNLVRSQTFNLKPGVYENVSNHYWWRRVENVGDDWIDLSAEYCDADSDVPQVGDVMVQLGDDTDPDYQSAIVLSAFGEGAPYLTMYQGIDSFSLSERDIFTVGYDRVKQECFVRIYGRTYIGDRQELSYIKKDSDGIEVRAKRFLFSNGEDIETRIEATERNITLKLGESGIDIENKQITVTTDRFLVQDSNGTGIAVFKMVDGKPLLRAENIDVDNLKVKVLDGAKGTFEELSSSTGGKLTINGGSLVMNAGDISMTSGSIRMASGSMLLGSAVSIGPERVYLYSADFQQQGTRDNRSLRFYASDIWCRGSFGAAERNIVVVDGSRARYMTKGIDGVATTVDMSQQTDTGGNKFYRIQCYGQESDAAGFPVDVIVINNASVYNYELSMFSTQRCLLINGNNNTSFKVYAAGFLKEFKGGVVCEVVKMDRYITPTQGDVLGKGILFSGMNDNNW